jgi:hypothetical protein
VVGPAAPAAAHLSPVARDYPSRAFAGPFRPPRLSVSSGWIKPVAQLFPPPPVVLCAPESLTSQVLGNLMASFPPLSLLLSLSHRGLQSLNRPHYFRTSNEALLSCTSTPPRASFSLTRRNARSPQHYASLKLFRPSASSSQSALLLHSYLR